ncbi:hypothetical protein SFC27_10090 [Bacillus licheniformis]|jgi:hypothetical protein|uniref:Phage related protein n=4 Tax=Bacillaceae TaxID=186817 RepID=Q65KP6_BACLD|nr:MULTISPECIES: hypothetical protein [Bacillus]MBY8349928.1 hypothetical protein [Bacillus sp. PCH94]AAU23013.1 phage related protein [Bacillus licheniformis DSM 13 = ATCC 14580]AAU40368.1 putative phage protein [Bacillus phage BLi_Pp3] [Bacillus licheniformis DSM 13 = ATCC 14580]APJ26621.1 hypothetical protein BSZ43_07410 [Bacillus sp. H15-1]ASV14994.1 hypothetical protein CJO35_07470 [Bacillus sp. 1s-1]
MAKLEIKLTEEARKRKEENPLSSVGLKFSDYDVLIDGHEPTHLTDLKLSMRVGELNEATVTFVVDEIDVDADFLAALEAKIEADKVAAASPEETTEDTTDADHSDEGSE